MEEYVNLKQGRISINKYAWKFHQLFMYALELVSNMRARIHMFLSRLSHEFILDSKVFLMNKDNDFFVLWFINNRLTKKIRSRMRFM